MNGTEIFCLFIYLVLKHSFQGLVKALDGNENRNRNIDLNYKQNKYFAVVNSFSRKGPHPIFTSSPVFENDSVLCFPDVVWKVVENFCTTVTETSTCSSY